MMHMHRTSGAADREPNETSLTGSLREALRGDAVPHLRQRARQQIQGGRQMVALLFVALGVCAVAAVAWTSNSDEQVVAQDPRSIAVESPEALRTQLATFANATLVARLGSEGERLDRRPEYATTLPADWLAALAGEIKAEPSAAPTDRDGGGGVGAELLLRRADGAVATFVLQANSSRWFLGARSWRKGWLLSEAGSSLIGQQILELREQTPQARRKQPVSTLAELLAAIGDDRQLEWVGEQDLEIPEDPRELAEFSFDRERVQIVNGVIELRGVRNFELRSAARERLRLLARNPAVVLRLVKCQDVWFRDVVIGHAANVGPHCTGAVVMANDCQGLHLRDCELFGCGSQALVFSNIRDFTCERTEMHTCTQNLMTLQRSQQLRFVACTMRDCQVWDQAALFIDNCTDVEFRDCRITGMRSQTASKPLFLIAGTEAVRVVGGQILGNRVSAVSSFDAAVVRTNVEERDNSTETKVAAIAR